MLPRRIASRYADALFEIAQGQKVTEAWDQALNTLATVMANTPELTALLTHPEIPLARKEAVLSRAFRGTVAPEILRLLSLLIKRGHDPDMATVRTLFRERWNAARRLVPVTVTSAAGLTPVQAAALTTVLSRRVGGHIELQQQVDPELIAGVVITMGDRVIDASTRHTLDRLREAMRGG